ncbi:IS21 family transposase [Bacillus thuringiensis]|uniref:Transposase for insertion sequence element IS232 n=1 Tax=Bacillus thuringiensis Bt18247 TaxID=1423143 RepID=A0A9W3XBE9_BACTU|nr:IS21 family transposase [Bacillus thuringiensis]AOM08779.1 transposase for insertion sequence element IS232 [Bacillus thuringiensis Bt18247]AOM09269.1 transposase for insertion sequence element IS232 [Bacillus thuringiensis Bt18247]AOM09560.1 transposase for insertion sequence element IS232 [Bacillus thuringiensis Bt18247]AOM09662.1 transposase for insertion sequence element IS232 [Bacillus thuringiensis Bt18247]AOM11673.1 transposase for insertion sequence element IS232 [Bacillus thuringie
MYIKLDISTEFEIKSLTDLSNLKSLMENLKMKVNKSKLARELNVDRRTIDKYMNGFTPKGTKKKTSKIDVHYEVIVDLLSDTSKQTFYYMRVLWQYLTDNHGLQCSQSNFRAYINKKPEFKKYFEEGKRTVSNHSGKVRYETPPGEQAQLDWKESIKFETKDGEIIYVNVAVLLLSYSRFRVFHLNISKSQSVLLSFITEAFETFGGVPKVIVTDNMKTVMDEARTEHFSGTINNKFVQFAQDFGFKVQPCIAGRPNTKGKIEAPMKLLDEIHAYQGKFSFEELHDFVQKLCTRINQTFHQGTGKIPIFALKQEKNLLQPLPQSTIRDSYKIKHKLVKVNSSGMISYKSNQYSVPPEYQGKTVGLQVYDNQIYVYHNMKLIVQHKISQSKLNYKEDHYKKALAKSLPKYPNIDNLAKQNLSVIGEVYKNEQ